MSGTSNSRQEDTSNPLTRFGLLFTIVFLVSLGAIAFSPELFSLGISVLLVCAIYLTAWALFEFRSGSISMPSGFTGVICTYRRDKDPVKFFVMVISCLAAGIFFSFSLGSLLLFGQGG